MTKKPLYRSLLILSILLLPACSMKDAVGRMGLELQRVQMRQVNNSGFSAMVYMRVDNPNWFSMRVADLDYRAEINGVEVAKGRIQQEIKIPAGDSVVAELPVEVSLDSMQGDGFEALRGRLNYRLTGEVVFKTWFGSYTLPFDTQRKRKDNAGGRW